LSKSYDRKMEDRKIKFFSSIQWDFHFSGQKFEVAKFLQT